MQIAGPIDPDAWLAFAEESGTLAEDTTTCVLAGMLVRVLKEGIPMHLQTMRDIEDLVADLRDVLKRSRKSGGQYFVHRDEGRCRPLAVTVHVPGEATKQQRRPNHVDGTPQAVEA